MLNLPFRSRLPESATNYPAVIMVHGWLGNDNVMWAFEQYLPKEAAVLAPRGVFAAEGGFGWWLHDNDAATFAQGIAALREFVAGMRAAYPVDPARVVLMGFSQGAAAAIALALSAPELVRGVALLAGFVPGFAREWVTPDRLEGKRVFIAHGVDDTTVPIDDAHSARDVLTAAGAQVTYGEYPVAHKMNPAGLRALRQWLIETTQ
ncbi:MAG: alpha/beta hydrolase [Anaerolineales bacterium]